MNKRAFVLAVDGPAASGKGTLSRHLAEHFDWAYLDTGGLYRAVARDALTNNSGNLDEASAAQAAHNLDFGTLQDPALRTADIGEAASVVAAMPKVREALIGTQRKFAYNPPEDKTGAILDGRDIGTVICPDAPVKLFVTASPEVRARRRHKDHLASASALTEAEVLAELHIRDQRDASRDQSPLKPAQEAHLLDTTEMSIEAAVTAAILIIEKEMETWQSRQYHKNL